MTERKKNATARFRSGRERPHQAVHYALKVLDVQMIADGVSIRDLSEKTGYNERTISAWLKGKYDAPLSKLEACFNVFGMTLKPSGLDKR